MERKRKLPARAAARVDHVSKKRNSTPPDVTTSASPSALASPQPAEHTAKEPTPAPSSVSAALPTSLQPGHPLPTVEKPQPDDLSHKDFQSIQESGVIAESLSRSRQKWIHDGIFEKYWSKPTKRKGVVKEDSNNPAKDTMTKLGQVTITVEPHLLEVTMYAVKDPKPAPASNSTLRPIMQYGPPNGSMPPPPKPTVTSTGVSAPAPATAASHSPSTAVPPSTQPAQPTQSARAPLQPISSPRDHEKPVTQQPPMTSAALPSTSAPPMSAASHHTELQRPQLPTPMDKPIVSPRGLESVLAAPQSAHARPPQPPLSQPPAPGNHPLHAPSTSTNPLSTGAGLPAGSMGGVKTNPPSKPVASPATAADPIIVTLAERASEDPHLRDLMKRVAIGEAAAHELSHFQRIIDQITFDYKAKGGQHGPSADRLIVDGRTVKYFADEVRNIVDIILASNPNQRSSDLRPPPGSDPLVLLLVKEALDRPSTKAFIQRVAEGKPKFADTMELKTLLDRLNAVAKQVVKSQQAATATTSQSTAQTPPIQQAKGEDGSKKITYPRPEPAAERPNAPNKPCDPKDRRLPRKPDISAVVLEFAGGAGDRYLFPKYSILEYSEDCTQVVASFLIVRRGSKLEYGGDRTLDYYQPVTIRLHSHTPKVLENLARVVAPEDEVQRYMNDVMENMTRAEYILLAMRLPRAEREEPAEERSDTPKVSESSNIPQLPGVMWDSRPTSTRPTPIKSTPAKSITEDGAVPEFY